MKKETISLEDLDKKINPEVLRQAKENAKSASAKERGEELLEQARRKR